MARVSSCFCRLSVVLAFMSLGITTAYAANGTWYSTNSVLGSAYWTNAYNWSASPYPSGPQAATFNNAGNGQTTVNLAGLSCISNITFDTAAAAAYILGSNGINQQTLVITNNGGVQVNSGVTNGQLFNAKVLLGTDRGTGAYTFRNDSASALLTFAGDLSVTNRGGTAGTKTLNVTGAGNVTISGNIQTNGASSLTLTDSATGTLTLTGSNRVNTVNANGGPFTLSGTNRIDALNINAAGPLNLSGTNIVTTLTVGGSGNSVLTVAAGSLVFANAGNNNLVANQDGIINGPGDIVLSISGTTDYANNYAALGRTLVVNARLTGDSGLELYGGTGATNGTFVLTGVNDFLRDVKINTSHVLSVSKIGNKGSTTSNLGKGSIITFAANNARGGILLYTGTGETSDRTLDVQYNATLDHSGTGLLKFTGVPTASSNAKTLTLQGSTAGTGEIAFVIPVGSGTTTSLAKSGTGTWSLTTNNLYAGTTTVGGGTLSLTGANGTITASTSYLLNGGTLLLNNTALANNTNRLSDTAAVTLNGGTLSLANDGGSVNTSEKVGAVTVNQNSSTLATAQAATGQTSTLTLASLTQSGAGTIDFSGTGLGTSARNRIFITGQPNGLIGAWATVNGTEPAAYDSVQGVIPATLFSSYADIAARGPSVITNNPGSTVRINSAGVSGPITLSDSTTVIDALLQNTATAATVDTAGKTLRTANIVIPPDKAAVTIGTAANDGALTAPVAGSTLYLGNMGTETLRVNAAIADNGSASALTTDGSGPVILAGSNTFSGVTTASGSQLVLANTYALLNSTLTASGAVFDSSVVSHAFTLGGLSGTFSLPLADNAGNPNAVALTVGNNNASTTHSGVLGGSGSLTKVGTGTLVLSGTNTYSGGSRVSDGTLETSIESGLGTGGVTNNATLNLTGGALAYTALSTALSGTGTVNVTLGTGTATTTLGGDYSGFTGIWNLGVGAAASAGRAQMEGADNSATTLNVLPNATLFASTPSTHSATVVLNGGNTGETYGQLRLEGSANWAGPVKLAGAITDPSDGFFGNNGGTGIVSGVISDLGGPYFVDRRGTGVSVFSGSNTYAGATWVRGGSMIITSLKNLGEASSLGAPMPTSNNVVKLGYATYTAILSYNGTGDTSDRVIDLAGTTGGATLDQSGDGLLKLTSDLTYSGVGSKTLTLQGSVSGAGEFAGMITNGVGSTVTVAKQGTGTWSLSRANSYSGGTTVGGGRLVAAHPKALGTGSITMTGTSGILELANDGADETPYNITLGVSAAGTLLSGVATGDTGISHAVGDLSLSLVTLTVARASSVLNGTPAISARSVNLSGGNAYTTILKPTDADLIVGSVAILSSSYAKTLKLDGLSTGNQVTGIISNGLNTVSIEKSNTGTWTLLGTNLYTGTTTVSGGTLALAGAGGAITASSGITLASNGILLLDNTDNNTDRLGNAAPVTLNGGTLRFAHSGGAANTSETAGPLIISQNTNTLSTSQADTDQTSALTFASLSLTGGSVNFSGTDLGLDARNQVLFTAPPALSGGIISPRATVNGTTFASYGAYGVTAYTGGFTDIAARGPSSTVPDDADLHARITTDGTSGVIDLAGTLTNRINTLQQTTLTDATVDTASKTFLAAGLIIDSGKAALTIGVNPGDGTLAALAPGGDLLLANYSASNLTVNAAVTDNTSASSLSQLGAGPITLMGACSYTGPTALNDGGVTFGSSALQTLTGVISGNGALTKSGSNLLQLLATNTYTGPTYMNQGIVRANQNATFGSTASGTFIADGATLDVGCTPDVGGTRPANGLTMGAEPFTVQGAGFDGLGAIINSSTGSQYNAFANMALAGNTVFGANQRWDIRSGTFAMNDFSVTKVGTNIFALTSTIVTPGNGTFDITQGQFRLETSTRMNGSAANTVTIRNGVDMQLYNMANATPWHLILEDGSMVSAASGSSGQNNWSGPVTLNGTVTLTGGSGFYKTLSGDISGAGNVVKTNSCTTSLTGLTNTYSGATAINAGTLSVTTLRNVGQACSLGMPANAVDGTLKIGSGTSSATLAYTGTGDTTDRILDLAGTTGGTTLQQVGSGLLKFTSDMTVSGTGAKTLTLRGTAAGELAGAVTNGSGSTVTLTKNEMNDWTLSGNNGFTGTTTVNGGTLTFSGSSACTGSMTVNGGTLVLSAPNAQGSGAITVAALGSNAMMRITPGATITGTGALQIGNVANANGAVYISGGTVTRTPTSGDSNFGFARANNSYGYLNMSGGFLSTPRLQMGGLNTGPTVGMALGRVSGGTLVFNEYILLARTNGCETVLTLDGGELIHTNASQNFTMAYGGGRSELNLTGGVIDNTGRDVTIRQVGTGVATGIVNLCQGTLKLNTFLNTSGTAWLNLSGGTLKAATATTALIPTTMTRVSVYGPFGTYAGGAMIDTDNKAVTIPAALSAPAGSGVYGITLAASGSGYIGEPYVSISGGSGEGATAVANMTDDGNGTFKVASITITAPGVNYATIPSVTFKGGGTTNQAVASSVSLAANTSGGLTKTGAGTLTLSAVNTYTGTTTVSAGTLKLGVTNALSTNTSIVLAGGTLDLNGFTITNAVDGTGIVTNGTVQTLLSPAGEGTVGTDTLTLFNTTLKGTYLADVTAEGTSDLVAVQGNINLSGLALQILNTANLNRQKAYTLLTCTGTRTGTFSSISTLPDSRWHVTYPADGSARLAFLDGTLIKLR